MSKPVVVSAHPMFPTADVGRSVGFYERQLGFKVVFRQGDEYVRMQRDSATLDLWKCTDPGMKGNEPGCWLIVENIEALFEEFSGAIPNFGLERSRPAVTALEIRPWGMEFSVIDPDNNVLHVGVWPR